MFAQGSSDLPVLEAGWKWSKAPQGEDSSAGLGSEMPPQGIRGCWVCHREGSSSAHPLLPTCRASNTLMCRTTALREHLSRAKCFPLN